ncbi:MAG: hypothetical protein AAF497_03340 [Planctomycetota bacterium]
MRYIKKLGVGICLAGIALLNSSCDFSGGGGGNDFNASQGVTVNWTGVYFGSLSGGLAVSGTSAGNITRFVLTQSGNTVEVLDDKGNKYVGRIGAPGVVADPDPVSGAFASSALLVQSQIAWEGKDEVAQRDVEFVGVLHIVAVTDIQGNSSLNTRNTTRTSQDTSNQNATSTTTGSQTVNVGSGTDNGQEDIDVTEQDISNDSTLSTQNDQSTQTTTFQVTEANSQFRLQGTWVEQGGGVFNVQADSPGGIATIITGAN